jgi:hypothetical protein
MVDFSPFFKHLRESVKSADGKEGVDFSSFCKGYGKAKGDQGGVKEE